MSALTASGSVRDALAAASDALGAAGVVTSRLDAELLLAAATGWERASLLADPDAGVEPSAAREFGAMVRRRVRREPVAYILGRRWFRGIELFLDRRTLIPRPETELLVEVAVELAPSTVLDVGTGSGAVALAIGAELPDARVTATDTSSAALDVARTNAERLGLSDRVAFAAGSFPDGEEFELTVANLPYVREDEWAELAPEITDYEPREALVSGPTGLEAIEAAIRAAGPGALTLEVGAGQAPAVAELVNEAGFAAVEARTDLAGIERVVTCRR